MIETYFDNITKYVFVIGGHMDNLKTVSYIIKNKMFSYNLKKTKLKKNSFIYKGKHPLIEVENVKNYLKLSKMLIDYNNKYWKLKNDIKIGGLMAQNLTTDYIKSEFDVDQPIVIGKYDKEIKDDFSIKNVFSTNSIVYNHVYMGALKLVSISEIKLDFSFVSEQGSNTFSPVESFIKDILIKNHLISKNARHGLHEKNECDIVDDSTGVQIEVVTEFKNRLKKEKMPHKNMNTMIIEIVDNNLIHTSPALLKKYTKKEYTDNYEKQLAIFCVGRSDSVITMLYELKKSLEKEKIKNNFKQIYILYYNFVSEKYHFISSTAGLLDVPHTNKKIIYKKNIDYDMMVDSNSYLMVCKNIFKNETFVMYLTKEEIQKYVKNLKVII